MGAEYLIAHPGNYKGHTVEQGIMHFLEGVASAAHGLKLGSLMLLIENTVGAGAQLGGTFEELHVMREFAPKLTEVPIGFCLDTCHLLASGFDIANASRIEAHAQRSGSTAGARQCARDPRQRFQRRAGIALSTGTRISATGILD
jgi:deoxyribonuclease-4